MLELFKCIYVFILSHLIGLNFKPKYDKCDGPEMNTIKFSIYVYSLIVYMMLLAVLFAFLVLAEMVLWRVSIILALSMCTPISYLANAVLKARNINIFRISVN
jgi:hypothetical protein